MRYTTFKASLLKSAFAVSTLLLVNGVAMADSAITLTAAPTSTTLPDGQTVHMWGYSCGAVTNATCTAANGAAQTGGWQPPLLTVPAGGQLTITLVNNLTFGANNIPTSLVIVGQLGGGLGDKTQRVTMPSPAHAAQGTSWPGTRGPADTSSCSSPDPLAPGLAGTFCPPGQADRVRSFATEVNVSDGAAGKVLPPWTNLRPGTYLIESGTEPSIQGSMGLYGMLVVTEAPTAATPPVSQAYGQTFDKDVALLFSEIDPLQNETVNTAVNTSGFSDALVWNGQAGQCGDPAVHTCYPPAVNYSPRYYLINGTSFDRTAPLNSAMSILAADPTSGVSASTTDKVLLRFVNAGLRMHVPSVVGTTLTLLAEDANKLPGLPKVQNEVFLAAGKTYDVTIQPKLVDPTASPTLYAAATYAVFDRALGLSTNNQRDGGMQAYINVAGGAVPAAATTLSAADKNFYCVAGTQLKVSDPSQGVLAGATGANGAVLGSTFTGNVSAANLSFQSSGTFTYTPPSSGPCDGSFTYLVNGTAPHTATITECDASVNGGNGCSVASAPVVGNVTFTSNVAGRYASPPPGVLAGVTSNPKGLALTANIVGSATGVSVNADGSFVATGAAASVTFQYQVKNSQGTPSNTASATVNFLPASNITVNVYDAPSMQPGKTPAKITDYRWIIEEDRTFWVDPKCQINSTDPAVRPSTCPPLPVESLGYNFHTANMPVVAQGCVGAISCESGQTLLGAGAVCDIGNGACRTDATQQTELNPGAVHLDPNKRYYISVLPGDGENTTVGGAGGPDANGKPFDIATACGPFTGPTGAWEPGGAGAMCGHAMGGAPIAPSQTTVNIGLQETPLPTAKIAVFVFEDDNPLNGENDAGGGVDIIAPNEPGLGGFELKLFDQAGGLGDATGQITYDMFNMPVSNSLAGTIDPATGQNACPISTRGDGMVGMIPTCPTFEADGTTMSPLAGQALVANLYPGLYEVVAAPAADRIGRGEEWLQTNTLDGGKAHEAFIKPNEPGYFQEFGPGGFHVSIGFANPQIINDRKTNSAKTGICDPLPTGGGLTCNSTLNVQVTNARMSRTPDQRIFSSGDYNAFGFTQCYLGIGPADGQDFAFAKCNPDGTANFTGLPKGDFKLTVFDQWNDIMLDGLVSPVTVDGSTASKEFPVTQWRTNLYTRTFIDGNGDGVSQDDEAGLPLVATNIRYRDGSFGFFNNTDLKGFAGFNEVFPFMNWLVVETDTTRYKTAGAHVVYDAGGPADGTPGGGSSTIAAGLANTIETTAVPTALRVPGARYCASADCPAGDTAGGSTGRVDPPTVGATEGWQGLLGQSSIIEFAMKQFAAGENGGIKGHVVYASTRPFDDPALSLQLSWEPLVPHVTINLYQEGTAADGTKTMTLVDTTTSTSWDDWAQGFRSDGKPNMNCPGQPSTSPFFQTLKDSKEYLDQSNPKKSLPNNSQFKCYDGWSQLNQVQPAPYDGMYKFPSVTSLDPATGKPVGTSCHMSSNAEPWGCIPNPDSSDPYRTGTPMLKAGKYVVEVIVPPGYELVKEEDKNILLGDVYIAPVTQQFAGLGNIYIMPDQAAVGQFYNAQNPGSLNLTTNLGATPRHEGDTGSIESFWPCVGTKRTVPDLNSLYPGAGQAAPFAGAERNLCDRKEVTLEDQATVLAKFYIFSSTHIAGHFTGTMTNDFASEFDPFSPQFGEKFGPPNLPVALRDFAGNEVSRVYADQWGLYNGLYFSTYGVNPPNPTGYVPQMAIACMNDPGPIPDPANSAQTITDPAYNPAYSNFCYETAFMPGFTAYMDTPVIPTQAFAEGYNLPDSEYPDATPAIKQVDGDAVGPWVGAAGAQLTITALGDKVVQNPAFAGPNATTAPYNQKTLTRHYVFGNTAGTVALVGSDGVSRPLTNVVWGNTTITGQVPAGVPDCTLQQRGQSSAQCGELVITAANGKTSIDTVTVTIGGKAPWHVTPAAVTPPSGSSITDYSANFGRSFPNPLQIAIDSAAAGDLIIVGPGTYRENLIMWKPVRLQGVGAASVTINADAHPSGKLDPWRRQVNCLFGLALSGIPSVSGTGTPSSAAYDPSGTYTCPDSMFFRADRIPFEGFVGWDASSNGNLAQLLQEPTLMGAYEGAGITAVGRGVRIPRNSNDFWGQGVGAGTFPDGSVYLTGGNTDCSTAGSSGRDYGTGNYLCNPSRIDGLSIINSSQGGGGIFMHGWNHKLEIGNNRVAANHGTLSGGINVGNGETPPAYVNDGTICGNDVPNPRPLCPPFTENTVANAIIPFQLNTNVRVHHNSITNNASLGDALFSGTPSGAGGITVSAGADSYKVDHNWISGNLSSGDGAGLVHSGFSSKGTISNNWVLFNQSVNPTLPTNGGGIAIIGANADVTVANGTECGTLTDVDCPPGIGDGTGPGLVIDANLIVGNSAESGSGGGLRLQGINGTEVGTFPQGPDPRSEGRNRSPGWNDATITNNVIVNNVAGWDGGGVSMQDSLKVTFVNNTVASNDTTGSAGVLFKTIGSAFASAPPPGCDPGTDPSGTCYGPDAPSANQPAGLVTMMNSPYLVASLGNNVSCPSGFGYSSNSTDANSCKRISRPLLINDLFWQNRVFHIQVGNKGTGIQNQQNLVNLTPALNQTATGQCANGAIFWDIGVRGDSSASSATIDPKIIAGGGTNPTLSLSNSILTSFGTPARYSGNGNLAPAASPVIAQYCNGSRVPPEISNETHGYNAPAGRSETTGLSPVFTLDGIRPAATVDEGQNWINLSYGPLTLGKPNASTATPAELMLASSVVGAPAGAYSIGGGSDAVNHGANAGLPATTAHDYFGTHRDRNAANPTDIGAVEFVPTVGPAIASVAPTSLLFGNVAMGSTSAAQTLTLSNTGGSTLTGIGLTFSSPRYSRPAGAAGGTCNTALGLAANSTCTINVVFSPTAAGAVPATLTIAASVPVTGSPVQLMGTGIAPATVSITPNPLRIAVRALFGTFATGNGTVTFKNTAAAGGASVTVGNVAVNAAAGSNGNWFFNKGADNCTNRTLAPQATCTVGVVFINLFAPTGADRAGTITFTDSGVGSPQTGTLIGHVN
jgi:hypothetical protein